jgi:hypothetical protein
VTVAVSELTRNEVWKVNGSSAIRFKDDLPAKKQSAFTYLQ